MEITLEGARNIPRQIVGIALGARYDESMTLRNRWSIFLLMNDWDLVECTLYPRDNNSCKLKVVRHLRGLPHYILQSSYKMLAMRGGYVEVGELISRFIDRYECEKCELVEFRGHRWFYSQIVGLLQIDEVICEGQFHECFQNTLPYQYNPQGSSLRRIEKEIKEGKWPHPVDMGQIL